MTDNDQDQARFGNDKGEPTESGDNEIRMEHPKTAGRGITRRTVLRYMSVGALGSIGAIPLLKAFGASSNSNGSMAAVTTAERKDSAVPIATKDHPLRHPITSDNSAIRSSRNPEKGPLVIYVWADYLSPEVIKSFEERYDVKVVVSNYSSINEAMNKIHSGAIKADLWVPDAIRLNQAIRAKLVQPINHSYIPNLSHAIPEAADPWYDKGALYSTPNFINTYGVGWRSDRINIDPSSLDIPWNVYWKVPADTPMGMVNADPYTTICMTLLSRGFTDFNRIGEEDIFAAMRDLQGVNGLKLQYTAFRPLALGVEKLAYCYNGDMLQIPRYLPPEVKLSDVHYFFPPDGRRGIILNDMWAVPKNATNPVLAHLFMNHFLELESAVANFRDVGYQTMLKDLTMERLKAEKVAEAHAIEMAYSPPEYQENGLPVPILNQQQLVWFARAFNQLATGVNA